MATITFDTLAFVEELVAAGVPEAQAKAQAKALSSVASEQLVTKEYLDARLKELEYRMTTRLGGIMIAGFTALGALMKMH
ncbi:MAG: DUF1640 domain-containing protein [Magnetococcales bacterium]|nr:DUF1640 domain-containing protein [Magnetococcales bacterium]